MENEHEIRISQSTQCTPDKQNIALKVTNALPNVTLLFKDPLATRGTTPVANMQQIPPGETLIVTTTSTTCDFEGGFTMASSDDSISFKISYAPTNPLSCNEPLQITFTATTGYLGETNFETYLLPHPDIRIRLYEGVLASAPDGYVVPLNIINGIKHCRQPVSTRKCNTQDFANSMFGPNVRSLEQIEAAYGQEFADFTGGQLECFVELWTDYWICPEECSRIPARDAALIDLLKDYILHASPNGPLRMWLPQIQYQPGTNPAIYLLSGYQRMDFVAYKRRWCRDTVHQFLLLFAAGAHYVFISAADDLPQGSPAVLPFDTAFLQSCLTTRADPFNSHYNKFIGPVPIPNKMGDYYLNIREDFAPQFCALILAFLVGRTINQQQIPPNSYNTFAQLEGWPFFFVSERHSVDFANSEATKWNISTYGASPYSEKRGTSIFIAPPGFIPQVYQTTGMMPYVGAYASPPLIPGNPPVPPPWLDTSLIIIPPSAPPLPEKFISCL